MILDTEIEIKLIGKNISYYECLGYEIPRYKYKNGKMSVKRGSSIKVKLEDVNNNCSEYVSVVCDICNRIYKTRYRDYWNGMKNGGFCACVECIYEKKKKLLMNKYGVENVFQLESTKEKLKKTNLLKYGVEYPMQSKEIFNKGLETNLIKYGVKYHFQSDEIKTTMRRNNLDKYGVEHVMQTDSYKEKSKNSMLERYGVEHALQFDKFKEKYINTIFNNQSCATSKQQIYLHSLYGGLINYPCKYYNLDIYLENDRICIEYDGGGHNLSVLMKDMTQRDFLLKEIKRSIIIKSQNINIIHIISKTDKLPLDNVLINILNISKEYFNNTNHTWIKWYLDENKMQNAENKDGIFYDFGKLKRVS